MVLHCGVCEALRGRAGLDKFLCDTFLEKIKDAAQREACRRQSGGRFTEAYMTWVVLAGANPGAQVIDGLNETKLTYKSVDHLAVLMLKRREAVMSTTTDQRLCWEALRVLTKAVDTERDSETKQVLVRLRVMSLSEFLKDPTHGAELYDTVQAGLEEFIRSRATQAAILRSEEGQRQPKVYDTEGQVDPRCDDPEQRREMKRLSCVQFVMGKNATSSSNSTAGGWCSLATAHMEMHAGLRMTLKDERR